MKNLYWKLEILPDLSFIRDPFQFQRLHFRELAGLCHSWTFARIVPREMENNSRRHTKKAYISRPRSILIDKEIRSVRDSRPISTTARTANNERANGRTNGYSTWQSRSSRVKKCHVALAEIRERWGRPTLEGTETRLRDRGTTGPRYRFTVFLTWPCEPTTRFPAAAAILSNGSRRGVSDLERERERGAGSVGRSRKTRNSLHHAE